MKAMIFSDLIVSKRSAMQLLAISIVICGFLTWGMSSVVAGTAAMATMTPLMYLFSIFAYDEMNGWERFRLTLPISKRQVAYGRYISTLVISVISLIFTLVISFVFVFVIQACGGLGMETDISDPEMPAAILYCGLAGFLFIVMLASLNLPLLMRFGMNKATRLLPLVLVVGVVLVGVLFNYITDGIDLSALNTFIDNNVAMLFVIAFAVVANLKTQASQ